MRIRVKVNPGSKTEGVKQLAPGMYQVRTRAPAEAGRANERVVELLAAAMGVATERVRIVAGLTKPLKVVEILDAEPRSRPPRER